MRRRTRGILGNYGFRRRPSPQRRRDTVPTAPTQNELDQRAQAALAKVRLDQFAAEPSTIEPFATSKIGWKVTVQKEGDVAVELDLDGTPVATSGEFLVAPESTTSYRLRARALGHSKILGTVTAQVDLAACVALSAEPVEVITAAIKYQINTDTSGIYFRPLLPSDPIIPIVAIQDDRMIITLRLAKSVNNFPDPAINIDASFALDVVPIPRHGPGRFLAGITTFQYDFHQLAPASQSINVDVSFPFYVWLIPGALIALPIVISGAEDNGHAKAAKMITDIVERLNDWFHQSYVQPPKMDKHDASFYVNPQGDQRFWINFCPAPSSPSSSDQPTSS
jgi:hypothetical protein